MNRYQDIVGRINYGLFLAVVVLLPFPQTALRFACVTWFITWVLELRWLKKPTFSFHLSSLTLQIPFMAFALWYAFKAISGFWASDHAAWSWQMERYMTFAFMLPVALWGVNRYYNWQHIGKVLVYTCVAAVPLYIIWMRVLFDHPDLIPYGMLTEEWHEHEQWWTFLSENISHFKHRLFLCSVELLGVAVAIQLYHKRLKLLLPLLIVMLSAIPLTGSRQSIITAVAMLAFGVLYFLPRMYRWRYGLGILLIGLLIGVGIFKTHPRLKTVHVQDMTEMREMSYDHDIRFNIWGAALQHPSDYLAYGLGAGQSHAYLGARYADVHFDYYAEKQYHAHNQYLEELMEIGIPGLLLFLLAWLSVPLCTKKKGRLTAILFTTLFCFNMLTDCMFGKFCGIALWAVGLMLIFLQSNAEGDEQATGNAQTH